MRDPIVAKWAVANKGLERAGMTRSLLVASDGAVFAGTERGGVYKWETVTKGWVRVSGEGLPIVAAPGAQVYSPVNALVIDANIIYAAANHAAFRIRVSAASAASGTVVSWAGVGANLLEPLVRTLATDGKGLLIAGTLNGAYSVSLAALASSTANTASWATYVGAQGEIASVVSRVDVDMVIATSAAPGKAARV